MSVKIIYPKLYQSKPKHGTIFGKYTSRDWKTTCGSLWNSNRLSYCVLENERLRGIPYRLAGTVNMLHDLSEAHHQHFWERICRALRRRKVIAFWIREVSKKSNRIHYHLIIASDHSEAELKEIINDSCPELNFQMQFDPIQKSAWWTNYILKIKISGTDRNSGVYNDDFYEYKRVLFAEDCILRKCNAIGDFWIKPQKQLWEDHVNALEAARVKENRPDREQLQNLLNDPDVIRESERIASITETPVGVIAKKLAIQLHQDPTFRDLLKDATDFIPFTPAPMTPPVNCKPDKELDDLHAEYVKRHGFPEPAPKPRKPRTKPRTRAAAVIPPMTLKTKKKAKKAHIPFDPAKCETL